jgi:phosphatidate cytidylyltransferase
MLFQRILTAAILIPPAVAAVLFLPTPYFALLVGAMSLIGAWEWTGLMQVQSVAQRSLYIALAAGLMAALYWAWQSNTAILKSVLLLTMGWWLVALVWVTRYPAGLPEGEPRRPMKMLVGLMILAPAFLAMTALHARPDAGPAWFMFLLLLIWAADTGAYFSGRQFGRRKLAVRVSPGKTVEGAVGGLLLSSLGAVAAGTLFFGFHGRPLWGFVLTCFAVVVFSIVGDLTESMFKRHVGMKDSGTLFPGHGGVLDRFDSLFAAAPLFVAGLTVLGL